MNYIEIYDTILALCASGVHNAKADRGVPLWPRNIEILGGLVTWQLVC
jgi:hypothetical protein